MGDAAMQERAAELALGPHARAAKIRPYEGIHFLFRAAAAGRLAAMRRLAEGLDKGAFGLRKRPDAARCWSGLPAQFEARLACVRLTDYRDPKARVPCPDLIATGPREKLGRRDGPGMAQLCLANRTPALLIFGLPPGKIALAREREYRRHGIDWVVTGDVYNDDFEAFRAAFNDTTVAAIEAERGRGYMERLSADIEARVSGKAQARQ